MNFDKEFNKIIGTIYKLCSESKAEKEIFHYTSIESLISIFNSKSIWASNSLFLNDKEELINLKTNIDNYIDKKKYTNEFKNTINLKFDKYSSVISERTYVVSFTKNKDSIPLWRIYGQNDGYNFGLLKQIFVETIYKEGCISLSSTNGKNEKIEALVLASDVNYDNIHKEKTISAYIDFIYKIFKKQNEIKEDSYKIYWSKLISDLILYAYLCKTPVFSIEEEYRIIIYIKNEDERHKVEHYRSRDGAIIPFIKINLEDNEMNFITQFNIGPCNNIELRQESLRLFLDHIKINKNYQILLSQIPYR